MEKNPYIGKITGHGAQHVQVTAKKPRKAAKSGKHKTADK